MCNAAMTCHEKLSNKGRTYFVTDSISLALYLQMRNIGHRRTLRKKIPKELIYLKLQLNETLSS